MNCRIRNTITLLILFSAVVGFSQGTGEPDPLKQKETELRESLNQLNESGNLLGSNPAYLTSEDQAIIQEEEEARLLEEMKVLFELAGNLAEQEEAGNDTEALRTLVVEKMSQVPAVLTGALERRQAEVKTLREKKLEASASELGILEEQIGSAQSVVNDFLGQAVSYIKASENLKMGDPEFRQKTIELLEFRARLLAARLKKQTAERTILRNRVSAKPDDADLVLKLGAAQVASNTSVRSLEVVVRLMESLELDATDYKAILIQSTGDISKGFEFAIFKEFLESGWDAVVVWFKEQAPGLSTKVLIFLLVLYIFHLIGVFIRKAITKAVHSDRVNVSRLLGAMIASTSYKLILMLGILVALMQIGISLTPVLAGLGVAGFIVGFALQETLSNFASGLMILFYRPFDEKDFVEAAGVKGWVHKMSLVSTTILTIDNQTLIVPNSKIWGDVICNRSDQETRRVDLVFGVSYSADIPHVERTIQEVLSGCDLILPEPEPVVRVHELADSSVNFVVRPWVKNADYWDVYWFLMREMKMRFDAEGIGIPFPQRDVHHHYPESGQAPSAPEA